MPIYEYECASCGERFEKLVKMNAEAPPCPRCAAADVQKLVSATSFVLKGGGWYKDHYGLKGASSSGGSSGSSSSGSSSSSGGSGSSGSSTSAA